jgi:hypothetical protein
MRRWALEAGMLLALFAAVTLAALALGTGEDVALLAGQAAFALALVLVIARGR